MKTWSHRHPAPALHLRPKYSLHFTPSQMTLQRPNHLNPVYVRREISAETLLEVALDPKHLGAQIGFFSVLHTWDQKLQLHPHVHCVLPAGGLSADHTRWIQARGSFFLPNKVLSRAFRGKFVASLRGAFTHANIGFHGHL